MIDGEFEPVAEPAGSGDGSGTGDAGRRLQSPWQRPDAAKVVPSDDP